MDDTKLITCDLILDWLQKKIENKEEVAPSTFLDASLKLSILIGDEEDRLYQLQQDIAVLKVAEIELGRSATEARLRVEATPIYKQMLQLKAKIGRIFEFIRIMKIRSRMKETEFYSM